MKSVRDAALLLPLLICTGFKLQTLTKPSPVKTDYTLLGTVTDATTGMAIEAAHVQLEEYAPDRDIKVGFSRPDGSFHFDGLAEGSYYVSVQKDQYGKGISAVVKKVILKADHEMKLDFKLKKAASISGKIMDEQGVGVPNLRVGVWMRTAAFGRPFLMFRASATTNADGAYQIGDLRAGQYLVGFLRPPVKAVLGSQGEPNDAKVYTRSFYPDARSLDDATPVTVTEEQEVHGIDIPTRKVNGYCVGASLPEGTDPHISVVVGLAEAGSKTEMAVGGGLLPAASSFHLCGIEPGSYVLSASLKQKNGKAPLMGMEPFILEKKNVILGSIAMSEPMEWKAQIVPDPPQTFPGGLAGSIRLHLEPVDRLPFAEETVYPEPVNDTLIFSATYPGEYWIDVEDSDSGFYVSKVSAGSRDGLKQPVRAGDGPLMINVRSDAASISGKLLPESSDPAGPALVVLVIEGTLFIRTAMSDVANQFKFNGLPPGQYKAFSLSGISRDQLTPELISRLSAQSDAKEITLLPSTSVTVDLRSLAPVV